MSLTRKFVSRLGASCLAALLGTASLAFAAELKPAAPPSRPAAIVSTPAPAKPTPMPAEADSPAGRLDAAKLGLDQIEAAISGENLADAELVRQRVALDPLSAQIVAVTTEVTPKLAAMKTRLDQLGAAPDPKTNPPAAPEDPLVTQERADQQKLVSANEDLIKRANLLQVRSDQIAGEISEKRRALFANAVFLSSSSILAPSLWLNIARETPRAVAATQAVSLDFFRHLATSLTGSSAVLLSILLLLLAGALTTAVFVARRVIPREASRHEPEDLQKTAAALWAGLAVAAIPVAGVAALFALSGWFALGEAALHPLSLALWRCAIRIALAAGMTVAILAPKRPLWRPLELSDRTAQRLARLVFTLTAIITLGKIVDAINETIGGSLDASVAGRGAFSLLAGFALARGLYGIVAAPDDEEDDSHLADEGPLWAPIRFIVWTATFAIIASALLGYIALSAFIVDQFVWASFVGGLLFLLLNLSESGAEAAFRPGSRLSRSLMVSLGLRRESLQQVGVLLSGAATVTLCAMAAILVLAPWGLQSHDMLGAAESAFFGFKIGDVTVSPSSLILALLFFAFGYALTHAAQTWLEKRYLPLTQLDQGLRASIRTSVGYVGVLLALGFSVAYLGINLEKLALVAGALSVGIGLGLQSVVNNFVSGLILLWERTIRVGDWVVIGDEQGFVRRINVRATEIETFDRATMIVPNGNMVTSVVKNFVRNDRMGRVKIPVPVVWGTDPEKVREVLIDAAKSQEEVVGIPAPSVLFVRIGPSALEFELVCFVEDVERAARVKSDLHFAIFSAFAEAGLQICATPQNVALDIKGIEPLLDRHFPPRGDIKP